MSAGTKIQWCDDTHNYWRGCAKVSPGCAHCYAEINVGVRMAGVEWGKGKPRVRSKSFEVPLAWNKRPVVCNLCGQAFHPLEAANHRHGTIMPALHRRRVFSLSLGDWLDDEVPLEWLADMLRVIAESPALDHLLLSKRLENWERRLLDALNLIVETAEAGPPKWSYATMQMVKNWLVGTPPKNVWVGASVEDQERAETRIPQLLDMVPATIRFLSVEPMLGPIDFSSPVLHPAFFNDRLTKRIQWVIFGGESGPKARPCHVEWIRDGVRQCKAAGVAVFVKQLGAHPFLGGVEQELCDPKGGDMAEWMGALRVREFPEEHSALRTPHSALP